MNFTAVCSVMLLMLGADVAENRVFHEPVKIQADGKPIDVQRHGYSAPFFGDFDNDGVRDLLVGQAHEGRLRIYRNLGSNGEPLFKEFTWFKADDQIARIEEGFVPQLVDIDGDGRTDLLSCYCAKELQCFRRLPDGTFSAPQQLFGKDGKSLAHRYSPIVFAVDWDRNSKMDLIVGNFDEEKREYQIQLLRGETKPFTFGAAEMLTIADKSSLDAGGMPIPVAADWDGDGKLDLIVGSAMGSVHWHRNLSEAGELKLAAAEQLLPPSAANNKRDEDLLPEEWGAHVKICVVDWNGDGKLDLLLGDHCGWFEAKPSQTIAEQEEERNAHEDLPKLQTDWAAAFAEYEREANSSNSNAERIAALRRRVVGLKTEIAAAQATRIRFQSYSQSHGFVWLFLRK